MPGGENGWMVLANNLICAWIAVDYMDRGFSPKYAGRRRCIAYACGMASYFLLVTAFNYLVGYEGVLGFGYSVILYIYGFAALKGSRGQMAVMSAIWVLIAFFGYYITASVARLATGFSLQYLHEIGLTLFYLSISSTVLKLVMAKFAVAAKKGMSGKSGAEELILAGAFSAVFLVVTGIVMLDVGNLSQDDKNLLSFSLLFGFLGIILSLAYFYHRIDGKNKEKLTAEYDRRQFMQQREQLEQLSQMCSELGRFRHDMTGMLDTVSGMLQNGKQEEALLCLYRMDSRLRNCPAPVKSTGNEGLDMALLRTNQSCRERGIDFHYAVGGNVRAYDAMDMGILFYNLLGNAVEACARLEREANAEISLQIWGKSEGILCRLENTIGESVLKKNPVLQSHKPEKLSHGFGLRSIRNIVEGCRGSYQISEEEGVFLQEIWLPLPKPNTVH